MILWIVCSCNGATSSAARNTVYASAQSWPLWPYKGATSRDTSCTCLHDHNCGNISRHDRSASLTMSWVYTGGTSRHKCRFFLCTCMYTGTCNEMASFKATGSAFELAHSSARLIFSACYGSSVEAASFAVNELSFCMPSKPTIDAPSCSVDAALLASTPGNDSEEG